MLHLLDLQSLFSLELLPKDFLHFLINVIGNLGVVDDLLLLHLDALLYHSHLELALFCLLNDFPFEFDLFFETRDLLLQQSFSLIRFELILLTEDLSDFSLFCLVREIHFLLEFVDLLDSLVPFVDEPCLVLGHELALLESPVGLKLKKFGLGFLA